MCYTKNALPLLRFCLIVSCLVSFLLFTALQSNALRVQFSYNIAHIIWNQTLFNDNQTVDERQKSLASIIKWIEWGTKPKSNLLVPETDSECSLIPAMLIAESHWRDDEFEIATDWLKKATEAQAYPAQQRAILIPREIDITEEANLKLSWTDPAWHISSDTESGKSKIIDEHLQLYYSNVTDKRQEYGIFWFKPLFLTYWHTLYLKAKVGKGSFLTVDLGYDTEVERVISYYEGQNTWQKFIIPIKSNEVRAIYISLGEPAISAVSPSYVVEIEALQFSLDQSVGTCSS